MRWKKFNSFNYTAPVFVYDKILQFKYNPQNPKTLGGFVSGLVNPIKRKGIYRIICFGGSTTAGYKLKNIDTWPHQLEKYLNLNSQIKFEVINAAVNGYGTNHIIRQIENLVPLYNPDFALIYTGWNGLGVLSDSFAFAPANVPTPQDNFVAKLDKYFQNNSYLYLSRIRGRIEEFIQHKRNREFEKKVEKENLNDGQWKNDISKISKKLKLNNCTPIFIQFPIWKNDQWEGRPLFSHYILGRNSWLGALNKNEHVFNLSQIFNQTPDSLHNRYFFDLMHLNAKGSQIFSQNLTDSLVKKFF